MPGSLFSCLGVFLKMRFRAVTRLPLRDCRTDAYDHWLSQEISDLIDRCLLPEPHQRPSAEEIFAFIRTDAVPVVRKLSAPGTPDVRQPPQLYRVSLTSEDSVPLKGSAAIADVNGSGLSESPVPDVESPVPVSVAHQSGECRVTNLAEGASGSIADSAALWDVRPPPKMPPDSLEVVQQMEQGQALQPLPRVRLGPPPNPFDF